MSVALNSAALDAAQKAYDAGNRLAGNPSEWPMVAAITAYLSHPNVKAENERLLAKIERMNAHGLCRDKRIRAQRAANRSNWEVLEMRLKWVPASRVIRDRISFWRKIATERKAEIDRLLAVKTTDPIRTRGE